MDKEVRGLLFFVIVLIVAAGTIIAKKDSQIKSLKQSLYSCSTENQSLEYELGICKFLYKKGVEGCVKN